MIYGIDFGTTYTVVSYFHDNEINFITFENSIFLPTENSGIKNLKRLLLQSLNEKSFYKNNEILKVLIDFFVYIKNQITSQNNEISVINCVLTVPIRFNDLNRYFIKYAAISAGFNVVKLIQEPIAAAISVINQHKLENGKYVVYDLGGGTFDATLIKKHDDIFHVLKVDGLEDFGGIDIDKYISNKFNISLEEAEIIKKEQYVESLDEVLNPTYKIIEKFIKEEGIKAVILTGGSSYLKNIHNYFKSSFAIIKSKNLQVLVSEGATLYGENFLKQSQFLIDVTPFNLGIEVLGDKLEVIIPENSPIPIKKKEKFIPVNKKTVIKILQGTSIIASECKKLGELLLESDAPFEVNFILDCDGILTVEVLDKVFAISSVFI